MVVERRFVEEESFKTWKQRTLKEKLFFWIAVPCVSIVSVEPSDPRYEAAPYEEVIVTGRDPFKFPLIKER